MRCPASPASGHPDGWQENGPILFYWIAVDNLGIEPILILSTTVMFPAFSQKLLTGQLFQVKPVGEFWPF